MKNSNKKWTKKEYDFLIKNYPEKGTKYCAENLCRSTRAILEKAQILNIKVNKKLKRNIKYTKEEIEIAVKNSLCYADVLRYIGSTPQAGNFDNIKNRIYEYNIDVSHFLSQSEITKIRLKEKNRNYFQQKPLSEILTLTPIRLDNRKIKKRLYKEELKKEECELCGQGPLWMGKEMSLRLDHINGNNKDYRLENLRIICPNCDATLETFCSGNRKNRKPIELKFDKSKINFINCVNCNKSFRQSNSKHKHCSQKCRRKFNYISKTRKRKVERPDFNELLNNINNIGYSATGRKYGVSDNAIRKWIKSNKNENT